MSAQAETTAGAARPVVLDLAAPDSNSADRTVEVRTLLREAVQGAASDLILVADAPPMTYVRGQWRPLSKFKLSAEQVASCVRSVLNEDQLGRLESHRDVDLGLEVPGVGRFRVNVHYQRGGIAAAFRAIPPQVPSFESLNLPLRILDFADAANGLVLVTGGTGHGKSTTIAAMIDHMNRTRDAHVITIEDPVEFTFRHGTCLIEQREIGEDSPSFGSALRHVLRQRPDVIVIGEMRDLETISAALTAAETGHLVIATLHTSSAAQTLARIIDVFPPVQQPQIRVQLAASLRAIVCQALLRDQLNDVLIPALEILVATTAVRRALRENEPHLIYSMMETGRNDGMNTLEQALASLVRDGRVSPDEAMAATPEPGRLARLIGYRGVDFGARAEEVDIVLAAGGPPGGVAGKGLG